MNKLHSSLVLILLTLITSVSASPLAESEFLQKMQSHHQSGLAMTELALKNTKNKEVIKLARKLKLDQKKEVQQIEKLQKKFYSNAPLEQQTTPPLVWVNDKDFLQKMSKHHKEGILLTSKLMPELERKEVHHIALKIMKKQGNEIDKMDRIQKRLPESL